MRKQTLVVSVLLMAGAFNFAYTGVKTAGYDYDLDYSEGFAIEDARRLVTNRPLYLDPGLSNGFESVKYPPVYYVVLAVLSPLMELSLLTGRLINIAATLISLGSICLISKEKTGLKRNLIPLIFLAPYVTIFTGLTIRVDMLALAFSLTGILFFLKEKRLTAVILFLLAFLTKQSFIAGFLACSLYSASRINWSNYLNYQKPVSAARDFLQEERGFLVFNTVYFTGVALSLGLLTALYPHFLENVFLANVGGFTLRWDLLKWLAVTFTPLFLLSLFQIYVDRDVLLGSYLGISSLLMLFQMMRGGAWVYAAIEPFAATVISSAVLFSKQRYRKTASYVVILQILIFMSAPLVSGNIFGVSQVPEMNRDSDARLSGYVEKGGTYSELSGFEIKRGDKVSTEIWGFYEQYSSGRVNKTEVRRFFRQKNYTIILAQKRLYKLPLESYLEENYRKIDEVTRRNTLLNRQSWEVYRWTG